MAGIEIFISIDETQVSFLSIPRSDIERLAVLPFRWIRYVMFAICGARGDLSTTPNGPAVDYENTEIANDGNTYYYQPSDCCAFVDYEGLNDRITTSSGTIRCADFRGDVIRRDGPACVVTQVVKDDCDAAHLIPHSEGDEYIRKVMQLRSPEVGSAPRLDMTENGILLSKTVHSMLSRGAVAFIKTPNYELRPEHIKRFRRGDERQAYITLQWIEKPKNFDPTNLELFQATQIAGMNPSLSMALDALQNIDAVFRGEGDPLPSTVILDYLYGIAAYKAWRSKRGDSFNQLEAYCNGHYAQIPPTSSAPPGGIDDTDVTSGPDDPNDSDHKPRKRHTMWTIWSKARGLFHSIVLGVNGAVYSDKTPDPQKENPFIQWTQCA